MNRSTGKPNGRPRRTTPEQDRQIRTLVRSGLSRSEVARRFGVPVTLVRERVAEVREESLPAQILAHLQAHGPSSAAELAQATGAPIGEVYHATHHLGRRGQATSIARVWHLPSQMPEDTRDPDRDRRRAALLVAMGVRA